MQNFSPLIGSLQWGQLRAYLFDYTEPARFIIRRTNRQREDG
jgi:hypothetical protein